MLVCPNCGAPLPAGEPGAIERCRYCEAEVRESWCDGETFTDLDDARRSAEHWSREIAGMRVHGTTRKVPREFFEQAEKSAMLAPPTEPFDVPLWADTPRCIPIITSRSRARSTRCRRSTATRRSAYAPTRRR